MRPPILGSPTFPAPTTRQRLPSSFKNIGNKLLIVFLSLRLFFLRSLAFHAAGHASLGQIARDRIDRLSRQVVPQFSIAVASKKMPEILARAGIREVSAQKPLDGFGNLSRQAAISHRPCEGLIQTKRPAQAEVVGIDHLAVDF